MASAADYNRPQPMSYEDQQRMAHATYVARMQRRSMPPRCNPFTILLLVMSIGMMFTGVTMTIIAHWPGATQIGENPLEIAGPVLFGIGVVLVLVSILLVYVINQRERRKFDEKLHVMVKDKIQTHSNRNSQLSSGGDNSGVARSASTGPTYYSNLDTDDPRERAVDTLPDPRQASKSGGYAASGESDNTIPQPLRVPKKRRSTQPRGEMSASDVSAGSGTGDLGPGMTSTLRGNEPSIGPQVYANLSYEADTPEDKRREKKKKEASESDKSGKRRPQRAEDADPIRDPVMRNIAAQQQQQLRVHIKAQPGTAVHITPSATPPTQQAPAYHARPHAGTGTSEGDSETEI